MTNEILIFPTDTVYGIGCSIYDKDNIENIYKIKNRDRSKPLAILCADLNQIEEIAYVSEDAKKLIKEFLPGPLTIILKTKEDVKKSFFFDTIGVRIPNHELALKILKENGPMATTSVNDSGEAAMNNYDEIYNKYHNKVKTIYKSDIKSSSLPSTVVDITKDEVKVLREGAISLAQIQKVIA